MQKCPDCGNEYEGSCPNCSPKEPDENEIITDEPEIAGSPDPGESRTADSNGNAALLTTVTDNFEASLLETRLKDSGIPVMLKYRETGAYLSFYMGKTSFGVDIFVPGELLEKARSIIETPPADEVEEEQIPDEDSLDAAKKEYQERVEFRSWIIFAAIFLVIAAAAVIALVVK